MADIQEKHELKQSFEEIFAKIQTWSRWGLLRKQCMSKKSRSSSSLESELSSEEKSSHIMTVKEAIDFTPVQHKHCIQITLENVITFSMISAKTSEKY